MQSAGLSLEASVKACLHIALPGPACELALGLQLRKLGCIIGICAIQHVSHQSTSTAQMCTPATLLSGWDALASTIKQMLGTQQPAGCSEQSVPGTNAQTVNWHQPGGSSLCVMQAITGWYKSFLTAILQPQDHDLELSSLPAMQPGRSPSPMDREMSYSAQMSRMSSQCV